MSQCRACEAPILFARTVTGKLMPVDAVPVADGTLILDGATVRHATFSDRDAGRPLYVSHFATCTEAPLFRRKR